MHAVVVYQSFWGIRPPSLAPSPGDRPEATPLTTDEATPDVVSTATRRRRSARPWLPTSDSQIREGLLREYGAPTPADTSHRSMRTWLEELHRQGPGRRVRDPLRFSPAADRTIETSSSSGYRPVMKGKKFLVTGKYGPLKAGELRRARRWGPARDGCPGPGTLLSSRGRARVPYPALARHSA